MKSVRLKGENLKKKIIKIYDKLLLLCDQWYNSEICEKLTKIIEKLTKYLIFNKI